MAPLLRDVFCIKLCLVSSFAFVAFVACAQFEGYGGMQLNTLPKAKSMTSDTKLDIALHMNTKAVHLVRHREQPPLNLQPSQLKYGPQLFVDAATQGVMQLLLTLPLFALLVTLWRWHPGGSSSSEMIALASFTSEKGSSTPDVQVEFYTTETCPFAQRTWMCLEEKGVRYSVNRVDLRGDRTWYIKNINPLGKVPAIVDKISGATLYESEVVNEFLEQQYQHQGNRLMPQDPAQCAQVRLWNSHLSNKLNPAIFQFMAKKEGSIVDLEAAMQYYEEKIKGPFLCGDFSLADISAFPFFERLLPQLQQVMGEGELDRRFLKVIQWFRNVEARPSTVRVKAAQLKLAQSAVQNAADDGLVPAIPPIPDTYKVLWAPAVGNSFREVATIREVETPKLGPSDVLIKVKYAGVNGGCETFRARGEYSFKKNAEAKDGFALGAEGAGIVVDIGNDVKSVAIGDAVAFLGGAFAEYVKCPAAGLWVIPKASAEAAAVRMSGFTAYAMLRGTGNPQPKQTVLITAAAGAAGHFAVQVAKLAGCHVIGTCSSLEKKKLLEDLRCDRIVLHKEECLAEVLEKEYPSKIDIILEGVGGMMFQTALDHLAPDGKLLQIGYISEYPHNANRAEEASRHELDAADMFWNVQTIQRGQQTIYGNAWPRDRVALANCKEEVLQLFKDGKLKAMVDKRPFIGLESVADAVDYMLTGQALGKVVVRIP